MEGIDDRSQPSNVCCFCSRLRSADERTCDAFPDGIPRAIWSGKDRHTQPVAGDQGLQFNWIDQEPT